MTAYRGAALKAAIANSDTTLELPAFDPAPQVGDTALVWVTGAAPSAPVYTPPSSGWAYVTGTRVFDAGSPGVALEAWWKRLTSADLGPTGWGWDPAHGTIVAGVVYSPATGKMVQPAEAAAAGGDTSSTTRTTPTLTTAGPRWLVFAYADRSGSTWTPGSGQTTRHDSRRGTASAVLVTDTGAELAAGSYSRTTTASVATGTRAEGVVALQEVDAPTTTPDPDPPPTEDTGSTSWLQVPSGFARLELLTPRPAGGGTGQEPPAGGTNPTPTGGLGTQALGTTPLGGS